MLKKLSEPTAEHPTGYDLLRNPRLNKGTAFTEAERRAWALEGLLPAAVLPIEMQVARLCAGYPTLARAPAIR